MSMVQGQPPPYSEAQVINSLAGVSDSTLLTLASQRSRSTEPGLKEEPDSGTNDNGNLDALKRKIYRHPLFPLLAMVFNKCESATFSPDSTSLNFEDEMKAFMKHQETLKTPLLEDEDEVNQLMLKAVQVLRIHLMEVEKVNELCKDFCARYISCLKGKLTSESLLHVEGCDSPPPADQSPTHSLLTLSPNVQVQTSPVSSAVMGGNVLLQQQQQPQIVSGNTVYQMVHTPQGIVAQPIQIQGPLTPLTQNTQPAIHGSTPLSQVGLSLSSTPQTQQQPQQQQPISNQQSQHLLQTPPDTKPICLPSTSDDTEEDDKNGKQKRGVLPKQATQIMKSWLFQHIVHPYPTEDEKRQIASQTNLTLLQVNNWFINARRRILQPMLEASNPDKVKPKKAAKPTNRPQQRFWPIQIDASNSDHEQFIKAEKENEGQRLETRSATPSKQAADRLAQTVAMDTAGAMASSEALLGLVQNGGLVLKLSPDGQLVPSTPVSTPNPASVTLENLHALQSSGLLFAPGPSPLPLHLPFNGLSPPTGLGLGLGSFPSLAAAASIMNFPSTYAPLQFANINTTPIDLSTMSSATPIQLNALAAGAAANAQILMGVACQGSSSDSERREGVMDHRQDLQTVTQDGGIVHHE